MKRPKGNTKSKARKLFLAAERKKKYKGPKKGVKPNWVSTVLRGNARPSEHNPPRVGENYTPDDAWGTMRDWTALSREPYPWHWATTTKAIECSLYEREGVNCTVEIIPVGTRVLVCMASRFGDVGIRHRRIYPASHGYSARVDPESLIEWSTGVDYVPSESTVVIESDTTDGEGNVQE
jgi:hypothetical protein